MNQLSKADWSVIWKKFNKWYRCSTNYKRLPSWRTQKNNITKLVNKQLKGE